ncbi:hypothetical protein KBJ98_02075 [Flavobacterium sp. F-328]|uniref:Uncharacterized protein n=1 Tax=Flavobacterium erciyesense TaxID=2825842 RepID=A0ABS5D0D5_9FLAO|nr:DUF6712 family protein [Flavobacterium erciyesense]MBQ0907483.1 hypothetical protein [Flavobacterium erciyesense]
MILTTTEDLKKYISVAQNFEFKDFEPYINKAINSYTNKYVGDLHALLKDEATNENAEILNQAREHLRSALANFGYFLFTPFNSVNMDSSGMSNTISENRKNIEWWQLNDIRRELLRSGHESMDLLLTILEENPLVFTVWTEKFASKNKELLVHNTTEFQKVYNIFDSRQTFLALTPAIRQVEDQYINCFLSDQLIQYLKSNPTEKTIVKLKEYLQKAIVHFTIAKVYDEGIFNLDSSGIKLKFDTLPNETAKAVDYGKAVEQLNRAIKKNIDNGSNYIGLGKDLIIANPESFSEFENPLKLKTPAKFKVYNTKGIVAL